MKFHVSTVLSIVTDRLVSLDHMDGIYKICDGMTGVSNFTHQLPRVASVIKPVILQQHPGLAEVVVPSFNGVKSFDMKEAIVKWLEEEVYPRFGEELELEPLSSYNAPNPLVELSDLVGDKPIHVIVTE